MLGTTNTEENKASLNGPEIQQPEAEEANAASAEEARANAQSLPERPAKRRPVKRWGALLLLLVGLAVLGYLQRERLLKVMLGVGTDQSSPSSEQAATGPKAALKVLYWQDPMHPAYKSDKPGKAPDCGMDLVPVYAEEGAMVKANLPEGAFQISPEKQQLIGVQFGVAVYKPVSRTLRTVGRLAWDETKISHVHSRVEGWVEQVFVDFTGEQVRKGQPLLSIYSPELWQTQQEYLLALKGRNELKNSPLREAVAGSESLLEAARKRLELWDIGWDQLQHLEHIGKPIKALNLNSPSDGFVLLRNAYPKQRVMPETELYTIADISTIWVIADIYEYEAPEIKLGQSAVVTLSYFPGKTFRGKVTYLYPQLDNATRTLKARIEIANPGFALKPDMFANVELEIGYGKQIVAPQEAVMDSGLEQLVFVAREGGYFEPRKVQLGAKVENEFIVLSGLKAGERVVTSANFLIDSESQLRAALGSMTMATGVTEMSGRPATTPSGEAPRASQMQIQFRSDPTPPRMQGTNLFVTLTDSNGNPISNASVQVVFFMAAMPAMGMAAMQNVAQLNSGGEGSYQGQIRLQSPGTWQVTITAERGGAILGRQQLSVTAVP